MTTTTPITTKSTRGGAPRIHPDARRSRLRTLMSAVDREVAALTGAAGQVEALRGAVAALATALDLGAEPATRLCPGCGAIAMEEASCCSECWITLTPP